MPVRSRSAASTHAYGELRTVEVGPGVWPYFMWTIGLSIPFWLAGSIVEGELAEGVPLSGLMVVCPAIAASILSYRSCGPEGASSLWRRALDVRSASSRRWIVPAALSIPSAVAATWAIMRVAGTAPSSVTVALPSLLLMSAVFLVAAFAEEIGWTAYATDALQQRLPALSTGLVIGAVWAVWHWIPLVSAGRSAWWIAWWSVFTIASRMLIVWLYNRSGRSVPVAIVFHAMTNVATVMFADLFDPVITGSIVAAVAVLVVAAGRSGLRNMAPAGA